MTNDAQYPPDQHPAGPPQSVNSQWVEWARKTNQGAPNAGTPGIALISICVALVFIGGAIALTANGLQIVVALFGCTLIMVGGMAGVGALVVYANRNTRR